MSYLGSCPVRPWDWNLHWLSWGNIGFSMANEFKGKCRCDTKPYQAEAWIWSHLTWRFANPYWHESSSLLLCFLPGLNIRRQNGFPESLDSLVSSPFFLAPSLEGLGKNLCVESASGHSFLILELPCKKKKKKSWITNLSASRNGFWGSLELEWVWF